MEALVFRLLKQGRRQRFLDARLLALRVVDLGMKLDRFEEDVPGLLDLASWHGTVGDTDPVQLRELIGAYVTAGGHRAALTERGGLAAEAWALGWHRMWAVEWFMEQPA